MAHPQACATARKGAESETGKGSSEWEPTPPKILTNADLEKMVDTRLALRPARVVRQERRMNLVTTID